MLETLQYFLLEEFEDNGDTVMYAPGSGFYADPAKGRSEIRIAYVTATATICAGPSSWWARAWPPTTPSGAC